MKQNENADYIEIKTILLGEQAVGKTSLIKSTIGVDFKEDPNPTLVSTYVEKHYNINGIKYLMKIWDTVGMEKYRSFTKIFYKNSNIIIFVYDITRQKTFDELEYWLNEVQNNIENFHVKAIVGNKTDLLDFEQVNEEAARDYAKSKKSCFKLVSAKVYPKNFSLFVEEMLKFYIKNKKGKLEENNAKVVLNSENNNKKSICHC